MTGAPSEPIPQLGPYRLLRELARGGMGAVYEAEHRETGARVALKQILPGLLRGLGAEALARFRREAELTARLHHPAIVPLHAAELEGPQPYLVQGFCPGGSLAERVARAPLSAAEARDLGGRLAAGLAHAHARGVVHRDLKPANVLFDEQGLPRIADFGLASARGEVEALTRTGELLGSPAYMPPEQIADPRSVDGRGDVYALGAVLYHALSGQAPYGGVGVYAVLNQVLQQERVPLSDRVPGLPPDLAAAIEGALAKDPARRPDAAAFGLALQRQSPARARRLGSVALVLAAIALGGVFAWSASRRAQRPTTPADAPAVTPASSPVATPADPPRWVREAAAAAARGDQVAAQQAVARGEIDPVDQRALELCAQADRCAQSWAEASPLESVVGWRDLVGLLYDAEFVLGQEPALPWTRAAQRRLAHAVGYWLCSATDAAFADGRERVQRMAHGEDPLVEALAPDGALFLRGAWVLRLAYGRGYEARTLDAIRIGTAAWATSPPVDWSSWRSLEGWELTVVALSVAELPLAAGSPLADDPVDLFALLEAARAYYARTINAPVDAPAPSNVVYGNYSWLLRRQIELHVTCLDGSGLVFSREDHLAEIRRLCGELPARDENDLARARAALYACDPNLLRRAAGALTSRRVTTEGKRRELQAMGDYLHAEAALCEGDAAEAERLLEPWVRAAERDDLLDLQAAYVHARALRGESTELPAECAGQLLGRSWRTVDYTRRILTEGAWWPGEGIAPDPPR